MPFQPAWSGAPSPSRPLRRIPWIHLVWQLHGTFHGKGVVAELRFDGAGEQVDAAAADGVACGHLGEVDAIEGALPEYSAARWIDVRAVWAFRFGWASPSGSTPRSIAPPPHHTGTAATKATAGWAPLGRGRRG